MAYFARGNKNYLAGEALVYVKCAPRNKPDFFYAMFVSSDYFRLDKFSTADFSKSLEVTGELCSLLPIKFASESEIFSISVRNILRPAKLMHETEDSAIDTCRDEAIKYINRYYEQVSAQYCIDFKEHSNFLEHRKLFRQNLSFLVDKMLEGYEGHLDLHQAEAAASLLRRICARHDEKTYKTASLLSEWAEDRTRPFERVKRMVRALEYKIKHAEQEPYETDSDLG